KKRAAEVFDAQRCIIPARPPDQIRPIAVPFVDFKAATIVQASLLTSDFLVQPRSFAAPGRIEDEESPSCAEHGAQRGEQPGLLRLGEMTEEETDQHTVMCVKREVAIEPVDLQNS